MDLTLEWKSVLPVRSTCRADGALPLGRTRRRNGEANELRAQRACLTTSVAPEVSGEGEDVSEEAGGSGLVTPLVGAPTPASHIARRGRRRQQLTSHARPRRRSRVPGGSLCLMTR